MPADARRTPLRIGLILRRSGTIIGFLLMVAFFWSQRPDTFMTARNWLNITQQISILGVIAYTMTIVMVLGDFDLSVGAMATLAGIVAAVVFRAELPTWAGVGAALLVGVVGGLLNGLMVAYLGILPFIATLGTLTMFGGLALSIASGKTIFGRAIPAEVGDFAKGGLTIALGGNQAIVIPNLTILALVVLLIVWLLLEQTVVGRRFYMIGGNREAARLGGIRVRWLRLSAFVATGFGAALGGLMLVSRLASANPTQGDNLMLPAIASVFLGMTMSEEGEPHVLGTLVGVFILGVLNNGLTQLSIDSYIQQVLTGLIIILAVALSSIARRGR